jgi:hypothetical protein
MSELEDELFLMTNLYPATTGLPMVIWVGPRYGVPHDVRIKVSQTHGQRMDPGNLAVVALRPQPHVVAGHLSSADLQVVSQWIALNEAAIMDHWNGVTDGAQLGQQLQRLPPNRTQRSASRTTTLHTITSAKRIVDGKFDLGIHFDDGFALADLSPVLAHGSVFEPLRDPERFAEVEVELDGRALFWLDDDGVVIDLSADTLWLMAHPERRHTITWVKPASGCRLDLTFDDKPNEVREIDLSAMLIGAFQPLREWRIFETAEVGPRGHTVLWRIGKDVIEFPADLLWLMARPV